MRTVAEALGALLLILLSTFFLLRDGDEIWALDAAAVPAQAAHDRMDLAGRAGWRTLGGYMRGQVLIALFHGIVGDDRPASSCGCRWPPRSAC